MVDSIMQMVVGSYVSSKMTPSESIVHISVDLKTKVCSQLP